ncbi:MAG TPA: PIN domain-containing protein [Saprospiraceae bacterium]|jgi:DNA-directed RNA polymerase subunit H (RpoH/RPB5)|nr:PIN domain-containing protein [Saprospiraceae bacterium]
MKTRNIFIDTQAFMRQGFKFEKNVLSRIKELGNQSLINIYISDVIKQEVDSKISEKLSKANKAKDELLKELSILESDLPKNIRDFLSDYQNSKINEIAKNGWAD